MAVTQKSNIFDQVSIAAQIIDGSIQIDSVAEFDNILKLFPSDPTLLRSYADLLVKKKRVEAAARSYREAAGLFIDAGMTLQAIVAKSLQWNLKPPEETSEIRMFFSTVKKAGGPQSPVETFFKRLSYPAMIKILYPLTKVRLPAGRVVKKAGDNEEDLYFIVSGTLRATTYFQRFDSFNRYVRDAGVKIAFPSDDLTLNVDGTIVWSREIDLDQGKAMALGIQFQDMSPKSRGMLLGFANNVGATQ